MGFHFSKPFRADWRRSSICFFIWSVACSCNLPHEAKKTLNGSFADNISVSVVSHNSWNSDSVRTILVNWRISWINWSKHKSFDKKIRSKNSKSTYFILISWKYGTFQPQTNDNNLINFFQASIRQNVTQKFGCYPENWESFFCCCKFNE